MILAPFSALRVLPAVTRSPPYLCRPQVDQPRMAAAPPLDLPRPDLFRLTFLYPFLLQLASLQASSWTPFGDPNRPKIGPRRVLRRHVWQNVDFHEIVRFPIENVQNRPQDGTKIGLRSAPDGAKTVLDSDCFLHRF